MHPVSTSRKLRQKGNTILEFALIAPFLMILLAGAFTLGMSLNLSIQASNVVRNANVLLARNIDLSNSENQQLLMRSAAGLGLNTPGTNIPSPTGKGIVILTKVVKVGPVHCSVGIPGWNGNPATCPNHNHYVIAQRISLGNPERGSSSLGNPSSTLSSDGRVSDANIATVSTNRASGFRTTSDGEGIIFLDLDTFTYVSEVFVDISELSMLWLTAPNIAIRNVS
ncbi:MAG: pilus assembly protein [Bryobacter sp.]|jgi:hypothetical protein|nr:pilus assembly protein [Bryobacter sp. CoA8 C33]